jgi:hypothetical protein
VTPLHAGTRFKKTQRAQAAAAWLKKKLGEPKIKRELSNAKSEPEKKSWAGQKTSRQRARRPGLKAAPPSHSREEELVTPLQAGTRVKKAQRAQAAAGWQKKKLGEPEIKRNLSDAKSEPEKQKLGGTKNEQAAS